MNKEIEHYDIEKETKKLLNSQDYDKKKEDWQLKNPKNQNLREFFETLGDGSFQV
jgi:hypothetical protein